MSLRIVFMGTPEFAVPSLDRLHNSEHEVVAVVTVADKPAGRGQKLSASAVKVYALQYNLPVLQPLKLRSAEFEQQLRALKADLFVVVAFRMLPETVWTLPPLGTINLHGSLLPQYRGAAPIHWAVMMGEKQTGCTTFFISHDIDTGAVIDSVTIDIHEDDTTGDVHDRMMHIGAELLLNTVNRIERGDVEVKEQDSMETRAALKHAPKLTRELAQINWLVPAETVHHHIMGLSPFPAAWTMLGSDVVKVYRSKIREGSSLEVAGSIIQDRNQLFVVCGGGSLIELLEIQPAGKKRMPVSAFLLGHNVNGARFSS